MRSIRFRRFKFDSVSQRVQLIAAAIFIVLAFFKALPLRADVAFTTPTNVSKDSTGFAPQMVVDSAGNVGIAYLDAGTVMFTNSLWFVRGAFTGGTFHPSSAPVQVAASVSASFSVALESSCVIDLAYPAGLGPSLQPTDEFFAQSTDCGATFTSTNVSNGRAGSPVNVNPKLLINNGLAEVIWGASTNPSSMGSTIFYAQRKSATDFTTPAPLSTSASLLCFDAFALPASGDTGTAWCDGANIWFLKSVSGAQPVRIGAGQSAEFAVDSTGNVYAVWMDSGSSPGVEFSRSNGQAGTFAPPKPLFTGFSGGPLSIDRIAIDADGNIDLLLAAELRIPLASDVTTDTHTILSSRSTDGGSTFANPVEIATLSCPLCGSGVTEEMAVDSNGVVNVAWQPAPGDGWTPPGFAFSSSNAQDTSFSARVPIAGVPAQGTVEIATDAANHALLVWSNKGVFITQGSAPSDFTISAAPATESLLPGGAAKFAVTLTATGGFSDAVNLSCTKLPSGAECAFDFSSITPKDSGSQATLTVTTPPTLAQGNYSFTIAAASGGVQHTQDVQVVVGGISGSVTPGSMTIAVGGSANFAVSLHSSGGFSGPVNLACGGAPSGMSCSFAPARASVAPNGSASSTLTVQVSVKPSVSMTPGAPENRWGPSLRNLPWMSLVVALLLAVFIFGVILRSPRRPKNLSLGQRQSAQRSAARSTRRSFVARGSGLLGMTRWWSASAAGLAALAFVLVLAMGLTSCGGATKSSTPSTTGATGGTGGTGSSGGTGSGGSGGTGSGGTGGSGTGGTGVGGASITTQFAVQAQSGGATVNLGAVSITVP